MIHMRSYEEKLTSFLLLTNLAVMTNHLVSKSFSPETIIQFTPNRIIQAQ